MNPAILMLQFKALNLGLDDKNKYIEFYEENKNNRELQITLDPLKTKTVVEEVMSEHFYEKSQWIRTSVESGSSKNGTGLNLMLFFGMSDYAKCMGEECTEYVMALIPKLYYEIVQINS
jgi:hypothetical protein